MKSIDEIAALTRAKEIATRTLAGELDPLQACRDMVALRHELADVPTVALDVFIAVASEVDDLPLGDERAGWNKKILAEKDEQAAVYRQRVRDAIFEAMQEVVNLRASSP